MRMFNANQCPISIADATKAHHVAVASATVTVTSRYGSVNPRSGTRAAYDAVSRIQHTAVAEASATYSINDSIVNFV